MLNASCLCKWSRLSKTAIHDRSGIICPPDGSSLIALAETDPDSDPQTVSYDEGSLADAAATGHLSTSDDPLFLIAPGDVVEVTVPPASGPGADASPTRVLRTVSPTGPYDPSTFHREAADWFADPHASDPSSYPPGSFASALMAPPDPKSGGSPKTLLHRASPDSPWVLGPRSKPSPKPARSMRADALSGRPS